MAERARRRFEARFLELPREVLISTLQDHQRYFPVRERGAASCCRTSSPSATSKAATRRRCAPATSAWCARACPMPRSSGAGSQAAARRARRRRSTPSPSRPSSARSATRCAAWRTLAGEIALLIDADRAEAERAAELAKCDLLSRMVGEFPELQGIMGRYYASADGEPAEVAARHRRALSAARRRRCVAGAPAPASPWRSPTSSTRSPASSPSARSPAAPRIRSACAAPPSACCASSSRRSSTSTCARWSTRAVRAAARAARDRRGQEVYDYMIERLRAYFLDAARSDGVRGITTEMFDAVRASEPVSPLDFDARLAALRRVPRAARSGEPHGGQQAHREHPEEGRRRRRAATVDVALLREPAEKALHEALAGIVRGRRARAGQARLHRGARAARHAASGRRCLLRWRDGQRRGPGAAPQPPGAARAAAPACSRASPTFPACRAERANTCSCWRR